MPVARLLSILAGILASVVAVISSGFGAFGTNVTTCFRIADPVAVGVNVGASILLVGFLALVGAETRAMEDPSRRTLLVGLIFWSSATTAAAVLWVAFATLLWGAGKEVNGQSVGFVAMTIEAVVYAATWAAPSIAVLAASCALTTRMPSSRAKAALRTARVGGVISGTAFLFLICVRPILC